MRGTNKEEQAALPPWLFPVRHFASTQEFATTEHLLILYLGDGCAVQDMRLASSDCPDRVALPLRDIVGQALRHNARGVVIAHNHPSGNVRPSPSDIAQTRLLARVLLPLNIAIEDHVIVAGDRFFSFRAEGLV
jgi:DNA repair protein RadC